MGYILLWIESLGVGLLLVATLLACIARLSGRAKPFLLALLVVLLCSAFYLGLLAAAIWLMYWDITGTWFYPLLALAVCFMLGAFWLWRRGFRVVGDDSSVPTAASWPRWKLAAALAAVFALNMMTFWNQDLAIQQQLAAVRADAGRLALSVAPARVPDRDNAALVYQQAFQAMGLEDSWKAAWDDKWDKWLEPGKDDFDPQDPGLQKFLRQQAPALALLRRAAEKPACYFEREYSQPNFGELAPQYDQLREAAHLLVLDARCRAAQRDLDTALRDVRSLLSMVGHLASDPTLVAMVFGYRIDTYATQTLQEVLAAGPVSDQSLAALLLDEPISYASLLQRAFRMEEAFGLSLICEAGTEFELGLFGDRSSGAIPAATPLYRVFLLTVDVDVYRWILRTARKLSTQPYYQARDEWRKQSEKYRAGPEGLFTKALVPALHRCAEYAARGDAQRSVARLAIAAYRYRYEHGRFPERLAELTPQYLTALPCDPFDGKPMRLKRTEHGLIVYSIGPDGTDDHGTPFDAKEERGDITFELSDPAPAPAGPNAADAKDEPPDSADSPQADG